MQKTSYADATTKAKLDLVDALQNTASTAPFATLSDAQLAAIHSLVESVKREMVPAKSPRVAAMPPSPGVRRRPAAIPSTPLRVASSSPGMPVLRQDPGTHVIEPNHYDPVRLRYPLRSRAPFSAEVNAIINEVTGWRFPRIFPTHPRQPA
jgi:hypothetical protein